MYNNRYTPMRWEKAESIHKLITGSGKNSIIQTVETGVSIFNVREGAKNWAEFDLVFCHPRIELVLNFTIPHTKET